MESLIALVLSAVCFHRVGPRLAAIAGRGSFLHANKPNYFTSNKSLPAKLTSPPPGGPGNTAITSLFPFSALAGIRNVPRIPVRDVRVIPVNDMSPTVTLVGLICVGGNGGCALPFNVTVTVNVSPGEPLSGVTAVTASSPPPPPGSWPPPPCCSPPPVPAVPRYLAMKYGNSAVTK